MLLRAQQTNLCGQHATANLVKFNRLKQRLEVAFAKALIALALDELEKDRAELDRKSVV